MQPVKINDWFSLIKIPCSTEPRPGQYIEVSQKRFYIAGINQQHFELIAPNAFCDMIIQQSDHEILGEALAPPKENAFYVWRVQNQGLSACVFYFKLYRKKFSGLVFIGTEDAFPFNPCPSRTLIPYLPNEAIAALPLLEDWQIPNRLASLQLMPGCFQGHVNDLAKYWLTKHQDRVDFYIDIV